MSWTTDWVAVAVTPGPGTLWTIVWTIRWVTGGSWVVIAGAVNVSGGRVSTAPLIVVVSAGKVSVDAGIRTVSTSVW